MSSSAKAVGASHPSVAVTGHRSCDLAEPLVVDDGGRDANARTGEPAPESDAAPPQPPGAHPALAGSVISLPVTVAAVTAAAVIALWPSVESLLSFWRSIHDYRHAPLIVVIAGIWLALAARSLRTERPCGSWAGVIALATVVAVWLVAVNSNSLILHQMLLPVAIWLALLAGAGRRAARRLIAPVAYLYFAIPVWEYFVPALQRMSIFAVEGMLGLAGVPAIVREYRVTIPEGTFGIVEGCSGSRYFMVALAVGVLAAYMYRMRSWRAVGFVAACGGLALLANWVRIFVVIYAGHVTNMQHYLVATEHVSFGNAIFVVLLIVIFVLAGWMSRASATGSRPGRGTEGDDRPPVEPSRHWFVALPLVLLGTTFILVQARARATVEPTRLGYLPVAAADWQGPLPPRASWAPHYVQPSAETRAAYSSREGATVEVYINLYAQQIQGQELVFYRNTLVAPDGWDREWLPRTTAIDSAAGNQLIGFHARSRHGDRWVIAYVYEVGGWQTSRDLWAQIAYGVRSILQPVPSGVIALAVRCEPNCEVAQALVQSFWDDMSDRLLGVVPDRAE